MRWRSCRPAANGQGEREGEGAGKAHLSGGLVGGGGWREGSGHVTPLPVSALVWNTPSLSLSRAPGLLAWSAIAVNWGLRTSARVKGLIVTRGNFLTGWVKKSSHLATIHSEVAAHC